MTGGLPAERTARIIQHREHVAIPDLGAAEFDATLGQGMLESQIGHHRADHRTLEHPGLVARHRQYVEQLITIDAAPQGIHHHHPVAVPSSARPTVARTPGTVSCSSSWRSNRSRR